MPISSGAVFQHSSHTALSNTLKSIDCADIHLTILQRELARVKHAPHSANDSIFLQAHARSVMPDAGIAEHSCHCIFLLCVSCEVVDI